LWEGVMTDGECFYHYCDFACYKGGEVLFCKKANQEILDVSTCPLGLWRKDATGWPENLR
jgi:hypothetical protein